MTAARDLPLMLRLVHALTYLVVRKTGRVTWALWVTGGLLLAFGPRRFAGGWMTAVTVAWLLALADRAWRTRRRFAVEAPASVVADGVSLP